MSTGGGAFSPRGEPGLFKVFARTYAWYLSFLGQTKEQIQAALSGRVFGTRNGFRELTPQSAGTIAANAVRVSSATFAPFFDRPDDYRIPRKDIPRSESANKFDSAYRYIVSVEVASEDGLHEFRSYVIPSSASLTVAQLRQQAEQDARESIIEGRDYGRLPAAGSSSWQIVGYTLVSVEKRSG